MADPENIKSGYRRAGLVPWDPTVLDQRKMVPSAIFQQDTPPVEDVEEDVQVDISVNHDCPALVSLTPRTGPGRNIILIQEKVTSIGAEVGPGGVTLPGLLPQHCTIHRTEEGPVTITPCTHHGDITALVKDLITLFHELNAFSLQIVINNKMIKETTILLSGTDLKIGTEMFRYTDLLEERQQQPSLSEAGEVIVEEELGLRTGSSSYNVSWGGDENKRQVELDHVQTNISVEVKEISFRMATLGEVVEMLDDLCEDIEFQLARLGLVGKILTLKLKVRAADAPEETAKYNGHSVCDNLSQSVSLASATCSHQVIRKEVTSLVKTMGTKPSDLRGIGITVSKLERKRLEQQGEATAGDLVSKSLHVLQRDHVETNVSVAVQDGISFHTGAEVLVFINELCEDLESQLARLGLVGNTLTLKLMVLAADAPEETAKYNGHSGTLSVTLDSATCCHRVICREVASLVKTMRAKPSDIRGIGISVSKLERKFENATTDVDKSQTQEQDAAAADVLMLAKSLKTEQEQMNVNDKRKQVKQFECMLNIEDEKRVQKFEKLRAAGLSADQVRGNWKYYDQINDLMF